MTTTVTEPSGLVSHRGKKTVNSGCDDGLTDNNIRTVVGEKLTVNVNKGIILEFSFV